MNSRKTTLHLPSSSRLGFPGILLLAGLARAAAQSPIVDDASLGLNGGGLIANDGLITIAPELGSLVGNNLFHSFTKFGVPAEITARFTGPDTVRNVIARVSGTDASHIDGTIDTISSMPTANFFLINPNGINFGGGARVDVGGSIAFSTADQLGFADGKIFPARIPVSENLSSVPVSQFGFLAAQPNGISIEGSQLVIRPTPYPAVEGGFVLDEDLLALPDRNLSLVAGGIRVRDAAVEASALNLVAVGDRPAGGPAASRNVNFDAANLNSIPDLVGTGAIDVNESYFETTVIRLLGGAMTVNLSDVFSYGMDAGGLGISIRSSGRFAAEDSFISVFTGTGGLSLSAHDISLTRGDDPGLYIELSTLALDDYAPRRAGDVLLTATDSITIEGWSVFSNAELDHSSGNVTVHAGGTLRLTEATGGVADIGEISTIAANSRRPLTGPDDKVGNVTVTAGRVEIVGAAEISSSSFLYLNEGLDLDEFDFAKSGNVSVSARESLTIDGGKPPGMRSEGVIGGATGIFSQFPGEIKALPNFLEDAEGPAVGDAGDVTINVGGAGLLSLRNGGRISSSGSRIESDAPDAHSDPGEIRITARQVSIDGGPGAVKSGIYSEGFLRSAGGTVVGGITIDGADKITISNQGEVSSKSALELAGNIRFINFLPGAQVRLESARVITLSGGDGAAGGDIFIGEPQALVLLNSEINSSALGSGGRGGNIALSSTIFLRQNSTLDASSRSGVSGAVSGADIPINLSDVVSPVQAVPVGDSLTLPEQSAVFQSRDISGHTVAGRGRQPRVPERYQLSFEKSGAKEKP